MRNWFEVETVNHGLQLINTDSISSITYDKNLNYTMINFIHPEPYRQVAIQGNAILRIKRALTITDDQVLLIKGE